MNQSMAPRASQNTRFIVTALDIAAGLQHVLARAMEIELEAMNAKTIVARAGESAGAIRPIADEAELLSRSIVNLANRISAQSLQITRSSITEFTEDVMASYFDRVHELGRDAAHIESLNRVTQAASTRLQAARNAVENEVRTLFRLLNDIDSNLLGATIMTSKFRIEASLSGTDYRENFDALVRKFDGAVLDIQKFTRNSKKALAAGLGIDSI